MDEENKLARACECNDEEKVLECLAEAYYDKNLRDWAHAAYGQDPDLFLRLLKNVHLRQDCTMSFILISIKGLLNDQMDGFEDEQFEKHYKLEKILPFYEAFVARDAERMKPRYIRYALRGYYALVMGLKEQLTVSLLQKVLSLFVTGVSHYAHCLQRRKFIKRFELNFLQLLSRLPTRKVFFVVEKTPLLKNFWLETMYRNYSMRRLQFYSKIYLQNNVLERNFVNSIKPFVGARSQSAPDDVYNDGNFASFFGVRHARELDFFEAMRVMKEREEMSFIIALDSFHERWPLTNVALELALEIGAYNSNVDNSSPTYYNQWNWLIIDYNLEPRLATL
ncbi:hypothetical protein Ciccas_012902, partial [Cichlidogyrus casuarinus]